MPFQNTKFSCFHRIKAAIHSNLELLLEIDGFLISFTKPSDPIGMTTTKFQVAKKWRKCERGHDLKEFDKWFNKNQGNWRLTNRRFQLIAKMLILRNSSANIQNAKVGSQTKKLVAAYSSYFA